MTPVTETDNTETATENPVDLQLQDRIATITIGTGRRFNALGLADWQALERACAVMAADESLNGVVIRGRGGNFCAGSDLREWENATAQDVDETFAQMERTMQAIEQLPMPTMAVIETIAAGAGCQLALACDIQISGESAKIGMPVSRLGILVPPAFAARLAERIGPSRAKDLLFSDRMLPAPDAAAMGLISTVVPDEDLDRTLKETLTGWNTVSAASLRTAKSAVNAALKQLTEQSRHTAVALRATDRVEFPQRVAAFLGRHKR
ncbi:enoyl-CoA hydratase/isomerase family protein [Arthrobacter sp. MI7-26]|uniref:enoyl-CoA hydratase/isomerase family protein n=1 Tax=Arthrobacter sp. MI7-26 TaxID=2993653 RepID=UPI002248918D|nr:enoyl-CoA hydratase/isomerase family protein [Arthrobacter sp. MI7-26]MCX2749262.1 enoyl-CoA hydratase/isomerase family protein [Arthrobacter sp. MI7-26]